jgi:hypothetical protein
MQGVQTEGTSDAGGGLNVGWIHNQDWMEYKVNAPAAGSYTVKFRVASPNAGSQLQLRKEDGGVLATVALPNTGAYQNWQTIETTVTLAAGPQTVRVISAGDANWNINWLELTSGGSTTPPPPPPPSFVGTGTTTRIEAENWSAMQGVQTESTIDAGGGLNVGWIDANDWMEYAYNAPVSGTYTLSLRIASGGRLTITANGTTVGTMVWENTGGFQSWQTISTTINLTQGAQRLRLTSGGGTPNINWLEIVSPASGAVTSGARIGGNTTEQPETAAPLSATAQGNTTEAGGLKEDGAVWLRVFPNPLATAADRITLQLNNSYQGPVRAVLTDMRGVAVKTFVLQKGNKGLFQTSLPLQRLIPGTYLLSVVATQNTKTMKTQSIQIVKQ